ncbi:MAG: sensor histidine kinase [Janthinobacterium lividum]
MRTLLLLSNLAVLALPLTALWAMRLYESALVRQTESELVAQGAVLAAAFREQLRHADPGEALPVARPPFPPTETALALARRPGLDLADDPVLPPPPDPAPAPRPAQSGALSVGQALSPVLHDAQAVTLAALRLTDARGVVVASTGADTGLSLMDWPEVSQVLAGSPLVSSMRRRDPVQASVGGVSRLSGLRVFVAMPVWGATGVAGAVVLSRTPRDLESAIWGKRRSLALLGVALTAAGALLAAALSRRVTGPLRRVVALAQVAAVGGEVVPLARPGTREVAELSAALTRMAITLEARARYVSAFAASVSHEFKTPLAALRGAAELLEEDGTESALEPAERARLLTVVAGSTARLDRLVRRLLDMARADMTRPGSSVTTPVAPLLATMAERYRASGLEVEVTAAEERVGLSSDALEALLASLLDNASVHAGPEPRVRVRVASAAGRTRLWLHDDGPGLSAANCLRAFDPFFTTVREAGGTGVGLPIARAIAVGAGGSVTLVETERGACFVVELPQGAAG